MNILVISFACFGLLGVVSYRTVSSLMIDQSKEDMKGLVEMASKEVDADILMSVTSIEDPEYEEISGILKKYETCRFIKYIYTLRLDGDVARFIVDADDESPADIGEECELYPSIREAFRGNVSCDEELHSDRWGTYYSAFAPIYDAEGKVVAVVGCDIDIYHIDKCIDNVKKITLVIVFGFAVVCFMSYYLMSRSIMRKDPLTDVLIYDKFLKTGNRLIKKGKITDYTCFIVNIKDFKYINQRLGSSKSDNILRQYAIRLKRSLQTKEYIARTGSDNFAILIKKKNEEKLLDIVSCMQISLRDGHQSESFQIYSRCGIYRIDTVHTMDDIMNACTVAINEARIPTAADYVVFEDCMFDDMVEENRILAEFSIGIQKEEFVVYYQPKVDSSENKLCGAEALVRWFKGGKMIPPNKFIPVLERDGGIIELDFYVFRRVCQDIAYWKSQGIEPVRISSNFSKMHLKDKDFADHIIRIVKKYGIDPKYLEIELTESSGYLDMDALTEFVKRMNEAHIHTSIDDFGTGYSSLSMLKDINVDIIKIDKSFLDNLSDDEITTEKMIRNVIRMVKDLRREVICEGVETKAQLEFLKGAGCYLIQGYLYDRPLPNSDFEERLRNPKYKMK